MQLATTSSLVWKAVGAALPTGLDLEAPGMSAVQYKDRGNEKYQDEQFLDAAQYYTQGLLAVPGVDEIAELKGMAKSQIRCWR